MEEVISKGTYLTIDIARQELYDEVVNNTYSRSGGRGKAGSPAKFLRALGFQNKRKDKLLKEVTVFLSLAKVV